MLVPLRDMLPWPKAIDIKHQHGAALIFLHADTAS